MKTTRLNQLYEHLDHGDLLPYQEAELRALEGGEGCSKKIVWGVVFFIIVSILLVILN